MRTAFVSAPTAWPTPGTHGRFVEIDIVALTPIYKGGSTTSKIDEGRPFRVPSIRGSLRYWWRATSQSRNRQELLAEEERIFGGVRGARPIASQVSVAVVHQQSTPGPRPRNKPYAFGVTGAEPAGEDRNRQVHERATARLRVEWSEPAVAPEVLRALHAWLLFGGIGGRTRRGAGSLWWGLTRSGAQLPEPPDSADALERSWRAIRPQRQDAPWPTLADGVLIVGPDRASAEDAWAEGLDGMRDVRASSGVRETFIAKRERGLLEWKREDYLTFSTGAGFVSGRAALGLPIRFEGKLGDFRLKPTDDNRYPSPVHLKVVQIATRFRPVYVVLRGPMPAHLTAESGRGRIQRDAGRGTIEPNGLNRFVELASRLPGWRRYA